MKRFNILTVVLIGSATALTSLLCGLGIGISLSKGNEFACAKKSQKMPKLEINEPEEDISYLSGRSKADLETLIQVNILFRHGARNQISSHPNDPPYYAIPPAGHGQLTALGKRQAFDLGRLLRHRYNGFQSPIYSNKEILVTSSDLDRTILTAQAFLAGYFPPAGGNDSENRWLAGLQWNSIPVHTIGKAADNLLYFEDYPCPRYSNLTQKWRGQDPDPDMERLYALHDDLFNYTATHSGRPIRNIRDIFLMADLFEVLETHGLSLPDWAESIYPSRTDYFVHLVLSLLGEGRELQEIRVGPLFSKIVTNMEIDHLAGGTERWKTYLYFGHDSSVVSLLSSLGLWDGARPQFCAAVILELHFQEAKGYFVKFFYHNDTSVSPIELKCGDCGSPCYFNKFKSTFAWLFRNEEEHQELFKLS